MFFAVIVLFILVFVFAVGAIMVDNKFGSGILAFFAVLSFIGAFYTQTHRIVPTQYVGVTKATISQELEGLQSSGIVSKPFLGSVHTYPASSNYERCEQYTPAIKGSYGIVLDVCYYYDTGNVDWISEINQTGSMDANTIMNVWRNGVVGDVALSVKDYTPEQLSDQRAEIEADIFENVSPWFTERGIPLVRISFKNWEFSSPEVALAFDESIISQRKITEQSALFEAAKISRERELYEAETSLLVAEQQTLSLSELGFTGDNAIEYLWIKHFSDNDKVPDTLILGNTPVTTPSN